MRFEYTHSAAAYRLPFPIQTVCVCMYCQYICVCFPHQCDAWKIYLYAVGACQTINVSHCMRIIFLHSGYLSSSTTTTSNNNIIIIMCTSHQIGFCNCFIKRTRAEIEIEACSITSECITELS